MTNALLALAGVILTLLGLLLFLALRKKRSLPEGLENTLQLTPQAQLFKLKKNANYWGVSVESHCSASSRLAGEKFPFEAAPHLPVSGCEAAACKCSFIGLLERRLRTERRRGIDRRASLRMESSERRAERPRRQAELVSWLAYRHL